MGGLCVEGGKGGVRVQGVREFPVLSTQFYYEPKTALKK